MLKESFSFFNTEAALKDQILETFTDFKIKGRFVNVEVSNSPEGGGGRRRDGNPFFVHHLRDYSILQRLQIVLLP